MLTLTAAAFAAATAFGALPVLETYVGGDSEHLGAAVAFGDVNGDGRPDVIVGADGGGGPNAYVDVYDGANLTARIWRFQGTGTGDFFGSALAVGDLNGDGKADVLVGAFGWDSPVLGTDVGYVRAFDGATGTRLFELQGQKSTDAFGASIAVGDVTGPNGVPDGVPDILVGAPFADTRGRNDNNGYVALFDGVNHKEVFRWVGAQHFDEMGRSVAFGDVNGDGRLDVVLGAGSGNLTDYGGYVLVIDGKDFTHQLYKFSDGLSNVKPEQNFGFAVASADVDGDGYADIVVGAYRGRNAPSRSAPATGYVRVYSGKDGRLMYQVNGVNDGDQFGRAVAVGDVTGDGLPDVIVGARWGANGGYVRVFDGPTGNLVDEEVATAAFDWLGSSVAAGDVDLNTKANIASGAYQGDSRSLSQGGYVRVYDH
jgi:hypothetical protein